MQANEMAMHRCCVMSKIPRPSTYCMGSITLMDDLKVIVLV